MPLQDAVPVGRQGTSTLGQGPGLGAGRGRGQGRKGGRRRGAGGTTECVCPKCGYKEPHVRGIPCSQKECPKCGTPMRGAFCL